MPPRKSEPEEQTAAPRIQILRPVPGLSPRWVGAVVSPGSGIVCNRVFDEEMRAILAHPECYRVISDDELSSALALWSPQAHPRPLKARQAARPRRGHLRVD